MLCASCRRREAALQAAPRNTKEAPQRCPTPPLDLASFTDTSRLRRTQSCKDTPPREEAQPCPPASAPLPSVTEAATKRNKGTRVLVCLWAWPTGRGITGFPPAARNSTSRASGPGRNRLKPGQRTGAPPPQRTGRRLGNPAGLSFFRVFLRAGPYAHCVSTCGDEMAGPRTVISPAAEARLGASSDLTSYSVRGGRVCSLKRVGPSKVMSEVSLTYHICEIKTPDTRWLTTTVARAIAPAQSSGRKTVYRVRGIWAGHPTYFSLIRLRELPWCSRGPRRCTVAAFTGKPCKSSEQQQHRKITIKPK